MAAEAGYSGTPLVKKLGLKDGQAAAFENLPDSQAALTEAALFSSVADHAEAGDGLDMVHYFTDSRAALNADIERLKASIKPDGMIWVSWPKKASKVTTDMTEDAVRDAALPIGLVDVKVCAVDAVWSGLKLMIRRELRAAH